MGFDMNLYRKAHLNNYDFYKPEFRHKLTLECGPASTQINPEKVRYLIEEVAYWRKENHIHKWFVDNVQAGVTDYDDSYLEGCKETMKMIGPHLNDTENEFYYSSSW